MIAALILSVVSIVLTWTLPFPWFYISLVPVVVAIWLMRGGGERWVKRK